MCVKKLFIVALIGFLGSGCLQQRSCRDGLLCERGSLDYDADGHFGYCDEYLAGHEPPLVQHSSIAGKTPGVLPLFLRANLAAQVLLKNPLHR
jgi:hypothetical protein